jgi:hypothetical protein
MRQAFWTDEGAADPSGPLERTPLGIFEISASEIDSRGC